MTVLNNSSYNLGKEQVFQFMILMSDSGKDNTVELPKAFPDFTVVFGIFLVLKEDL